MHWLLLRILNSVLLDGGLMPLLLPPPESPPESTAL